MLRDETIGLLAHFSTRELIPLENISHTAFFHMGDDYCNGGRGVETVKKDNSVSVCFNYNLLPSSSVGLVWWGEGGGGAGG